MQNVVRRYHSIPLKKVKYSNEYVENLNYFMNL